ncbi:MAG: ribosomal protein methyltransferase [Rhodospirillaceae bacterium]|nr:ribosomal protein methyltransferase [Rhodospirillaceae bacterium]
MTVLWTVRLRLDAAGAEAAEAALEPFAEALSRYEVEGGIRWEVEALIAGRPDRRAIGRALAEIGEPEFAPLPPRDWVAESRRALPPIFAGRFYLRGAHVEGPTPRGKIALLVDAGAAFGTGRHETTRGCLLAMSRLAKDGRRFRNPLDLGCGSGVLALAAAKLWPGQVLAADNDPDAVRVARENAVINGLGDRVAVVKSNGYAAAGIRRRAPFDFVLANILAKPLCRMAPALARNLAPGGRAVLSGLLKTQEPEVLDAHRRQELVLDFRLRLGDWSVLVLRKPVPKAALKKKRRPRV